jgi:hypothetical protein
METLIFQTLWSKIPIFVTKLTKKAIFSRWNLKINKANFDAFFHIYLTLMKMVVMRKKSGGVVGMKTVGVKVLVKKTGGVMEP